MTARTSPLTAERAAEIGKDLLTDDGLAGLCEVVVGIDHYGYYVIALDEEGERRGRKINSEHALSEFWNDCTADVAPEFDYDDDPVL